MNIEELEQIKEDLKAVYNVIYNFYDMLCDNMQVRVKRIETLITAYEKEKEKNSKLLEVLDTVNHEKGVFIESYEKEKEKNKKIDEFCRKELAFERRLKRENREPDEFNQGRFYVSENIRKIIEEE